MDIKEQIVEEIRLSLLASYNENRPQKQVICNEDAPAIWKERAETTLAKILSLLTSTEDRQETSVYTVNPDGSLMEGIPDAIMLLRYK